MEPISRESMTQRKGVWLHETTNLFRLSRFYCPYCRTKVHTCTVNVHACCQFHLNLCLYWRTICIICDSSCLVDCLWWSLWLSIYFMKYEPCIVLCSFSTLTIRTSHNLICFSVKLLLGILRGCVGSTTATNVAVILS